MPTFFDEEPNEPSEDHEQLGPDFFQTDRPEGRGQIHFYYIDETGDWTPYKDIDFRPDVARNEDGTPLIIMDDVLIKGEMFITENVVDIKTGELIPYKKWSAEFDYYEIVSDMFDDLDDYDAIQGGTIGYSIT
jgi:hypothetical protein